MTSQTRSHRSRNKDASVLGIVLTGVVWPSARRIAFSLVYGIFRYLVDHPVTTAPPNPMAETSDQQFPPAPRIEEHPAIELQESAHVRRPAPFHLWMDGQQKADRADSDRSRDGACSCSVDFRYGKRQPRNEMFYLAFSLRCSPAAFSADLRLRRRRMSRRHCCATSASIRRWARRCLWICPFNGRIRADRSRCASISGKP